MEHAGRIVDIFKKLDVDNSASLSYEELKAVFKQLGIGGDEALIGKAFRAMDVDGDGFLSFTEFTQGALLMFQDLLESRFPMLFKEHDKDGDGYLYQEEAQHFLANAFHLAERNSRKQPRDVLDELFPGSKKKISFREMRD